MNHFQDYSEFLETGTDPGASHSHSRSQTGTKNKKTIQDEPCSPSDIDAMLKKKFYNCPYPTDLTLQNIFCPLCGKQVAPALMNLAYESAIYHRKFLAHEPCLNEQASIFLSDQFDHVEEMKIDPWNPVKKMKPISIGDRQFCLQLCISHPLSDFKFMKLINKGLLNENSIRWDLKSDSDQHCYLANMICFPFVDFKISLTLSEIGLGDNKKIMSNYVNLSRNKNLQMKSIIAKSDQISLQILIHSSSEEKQKAINQMNYKYRYRHGLQLPIIQLVAIQVQVPEQTDLQYQNANSNIVEQLLFEKDQRQSSYNMSDCYSPLHSAVNSNLNRYSHKQIRQGSLTSSPQKNIDRSFGSEKQKVDLERLIATNKLSFYVRNNIQSRIFQNFLEQATNQQIELIIKTLYSELSDLITDQYANYMTQKLFQVCLPCQRIQILSYLYESIPGLVRNKQGTHTIQYFLTFLTQDQEYKLICQSIEKQYEGLCFHSISTHFIRKVINVFPLKHTLHFFHATNKMFMKFAIDKNAMCVIKQMLKKLKQLQETEFQLTCEIKKHFINSITFNTDKIIQDCYGNYVIQFCFELFGEAKSSGITEMIIEKFVQFSIQKYSSSVISKCINVYWTDKSYLTRLKDALRNQGIIEMFRNRQGNKILLDLMDKNENTPLRDKIYKVLATTGQPTKFYHDRWGFQIGIRSGPVGIEARSFGQAVNLTKQASFKSGSTKKSKKK